MPSIEESVGTKEFRPHRPEQPKNYSERLKKLLGEISKKTNQEIEERYGLHTFLNDDCTISMEGYADSWGGIYTEDEIQAHKDEIVRREVGFSGANNPNTREFYRTEYGIQDQGGILRRRRENIEKSKSGQMEMATTALLVKILGDRFLVVRSATYDDYNGVDNIILNKQTGEAVCAFDEVHEGGKGELTSDKEKKMKKIARGEGAEISYGMNLEGGQLRRAKMKNVPVFYLSLKREELDNLLDNMNFDPGSQATDVENEIFSKLLKSLRQQQQELLKDRKVSSAIVQRKLVSFGRLLTDLEHLGTKLH